ncbi:MAG: hypothetical protein UU82_C0009G0011 [Candidatus Nomurabacteria bacterium GW2011_GWC2_41_8]|uniref:Uncharacterized protein n=2 Tax=Candidatus Nomuraibacteriota TaxID=1752729 RepID=A0A0G0XH38_9BACT|nr:MAG: hypothetical protein UU58_C0017G0008 [Candidatus Nomurabacteria bacterium GW2011_GWA2_41_25]KKS24205.1 MAG: hypothetical protein UU82_C0009G0011 [Candidatus Nomurabacteria bacterium GW2011_GWC2_41_8]
MNPVRNSQNGKVLLKNNNNQLSLYINICTDGMIFKRDEYNRKNYCVGNSSSSCHLGNNFNIKEQ